MQESTAGTATSERLQVGRALGQVLKHPLALLAAGAVVSGLFLPSLTRQWQLEEKEVDLKAELVSDISQKTTDFLIAIQGLEVGRSQFGISGPRLTRDLDDLNALPTVRD